MTKEIADAIYGLNNVEWRVLLAAWESSDGNGHDFGLVEDVVVDKVLTDELGLTKNQIGGYISALSQKGILSVYGAVTTDSGRWTQFVLGFQEDMWDADERKAWEVLSDCWKRWGNHQRWGS